MNSKESAENPESSKLTLGLAAPVGSPPDPGLLAELANADLRYSIFEYEPPRDRRHVVELIQRTITGGIDLVIFRSAETFNTTVRAAEASGFARRFIDALCDIEVIVTSESAARCAEAAGIGTARVSVDETVIQSWRQLLQALDSQTMLLNRSVAIEVWPDAHSIEEGLSARGATVFRLDPFAPTANVSPSTDLIDAVLAGNINAIAFTSADSICHFVAQVVKKLQPENKLSSSILPSNLPVRLQHMLEEITVTASGSALCEFANARLGVPVSDVSILNSPVTLHHNARSRTIIQMSQTDSAPAADSNLPAWHDSPFMKACRGEETEVTPIWMMRQAGRYMEEYREVRAKVSFLDLCANPGLCSEVMCTAVDRLGVDAAIIFSDLLPILVPMGCDLEFVKGDGPKIHNPVRTAGDIDRIKPLENNDELMFVMETVTQTRKDLPEGIPLIGFAGAPFTLASYMIEGGASRNYASTKQLMFGDSAAWSQLMEHLTVSISLYLNGQVQAGAQCLQIFDSWAGCLSVPDYRTYVLPYVKRIVASIPEHVPVINFATGNPALLPLLAEANPRVVGVDWRIGLDQAWETVGSTYAVQGNLDPTVLLTNPDEIRRQAKRVLDEAAGRPGHIFNLGHGILPQTPVENAIALVESVHELSAK
ncbi:MAG: uroporphyrinogen decarboxylase [Planctomycetota bacterium]